MMDLKPPPGSFDIDVPGEDESALDAIWDKIASGELKYVTVDPDDPAHTVPVVTRDYSPDKALSELRAWQHYQKSGKARPFTFEMLRGDPADEIETRLKTGETPAVIVEALKSRFDGSRLKALERAAVALVDLVLSASDEDVTEAGIHVTVKSIGELESDYASRFATMINDFRRNKPRDDSKAAAILRYLNQVFIRSGYIEGMATGGVEDAPDDEDNAAIRALVSDANGYVDSFVATLYGDGISDARAAGKAGQWWRGAIMPAVSAGLLSANGNLMMEFGGEDGNEICPTCQRLKGQRHRFKDWKKRNLDVPKIGQATDCGGWKCNHKLIPVTGKAAGGW